MNTVPKVDSKLASKALGHSLQESHLMVVSQMVIRSVSKITLYIVCLRDQMYTICKDCRCKGLTYPPICNGDAE